MYSQTFAKSHLVAVDSPYMLFVMVPAMCMPKHYIQNFLNWVVSENIHAPPTEGFLVWAPPGPENSSLAS